MQINFSKKLSSTTTKTEIYRRFLASKCVPWWKRLYINTTVKETDYAYTIWLIRVKEYINRFLSLFLLFFGGFFFSPNFSPPGDDRFGYEQACERWSPVHTVSTILISVISMLSSPNDESPANVPAASEWRERPNGKNLLIKKKKINQAKEV